MENASKALVMAGAVFMFIIAISVAIFSYNTVREVIDSILTSSENNSRAAEYAVAITEDLDRYATKAEIIMAIYSLDDIDFVAKTIKVGSFEFTKESFKTVEGRNEIERKIANIEDRNYLVSYNSSTYSNSGDTVVIYTPPVS